MCGIVGYTGFQNAVDVVFDGLKTLEYRGYDSAGIAVVGDKVQTFKTVGRVSTLEKKLPRDKFFTAIGHTRWATHGVPLERNAHPHLSFDGKIAVVHNGIIENFKELKYALTKQAVTFSSDTDSEIIAHLLALNGDVDFLKRVETVSKLLKGASTFLAIREGDDSIYCSKRGASLAIGLGEGENFVASDTLAICDYSKSVVPLSDGDVAKISRDGIKVFANGERVFRPAYAVSRTRPKISDCFMRSEIGEIPGAVARTLEGFLRTSGASGEEALARASKVLFVGCGTAYHACIYAKHIFSRLLKKDCEAIESSEFDETVVKRDSVAVFITQSGETADTVLAAEKCKERGVYSIAICNVRGSLMSFVADAVYYTEAGAEVAVAATKSYVCQLALVYALAKRCGGKTLDEKFVENLSNCLETAVTQNAYTPCVLDKKLFFVGKGRDVVTAKEAALKVKEITYRMTDAYPAGELKHGPIALIDEESFAVVIATEKKDESRVEATVSELRSRGAYVLAVSGIGDIGANETINLPVPKDENLFPLVAILPLQNLALKMSLELGLNPDKPRNLAKSVTVI